jgi:hypothetical protein
MSHRNRLLWLYGLVVLVAGMPARADITFNTFATPDPTTFSGGTIGFAYAGNKFVGTTYNGGFYQTDLTGHNIQQFGAPGIISGSSVEHFVAASSGYGGFANRDIYVAQGDTVIHVTNDGSSFNTFATGLSGGVRGIVFDTVGTFNHDMIVTTASGNIYTVDSSGHATLLASVGEDTEGATIIPLGAHFSSYDGQLIVGSEGSGTLRAISNTGVVTPIATVSSAEEVSFVPLNLGASHNPLEGLYGANFTPNVIKADANQFSSYLGDLVVTGETTHDVTDVHWDGTNFVNTRIGGFPNQPEDGIFVTAAVLNTPEPSTMLVAVTAVPLAIGVWYHRRRGAQKAGV